MSEPGGSHAGGPRLAMTEVRVRDWEAAARWYADTLGLRRVLADPNGRFALLAAGPGRVALKGVRDGEEPPRAGGVRLVFQVGDVDAEFWRLRGLGQDVTGPADHPVEPYREIRLSDPDGNPVTLFSWRGEPPTAHGLALV